MAALCAAASRLLGKRLLLGTSCKVTLACQAW
ncbi:hypothetical protein GDO81_011963 [Engystomops pustulosus]|uniref:Uncharacterized protein n=1 Tax=Engystomops pustulosus TaxID=76066 RepID=A0AAV7BI31_ENGPU|nr:hypothetical protein GDO81_011963 [Engystomops pustulosus]